MDNHVREREYRFTGLYEPAEEGGYVVTCPALPGLVTEGETLEEARQMARDAIRAYVESLKNDGMPIPTDKNSPSILLRRSSESLSQLDGFLCARLGSFFVHHASGSHYWAVTPRLLRYL